jgi:hypothetical protein
MKKQRMDGASARDVKYENADKITIYVVDQDIGVRKDSKEIQQKLLSMAS